MYKKVLPKPRWSPFLKLSAPAYSVKPVIVGYPHLVHSACLITTHLPTDGWPGWGDLDGWLNNQRVWTWTEPVTNVTH